MSPRDWSDGSLTINLANRANNFQEETFINSDLPKSLIAQAKQIYQIGC